MFGVMLNGDKCKKRAQPKRERQIYILALPTKVRLFDKAIDDAAKAEYTQERADKIERRAL
jgi:hypothetical protein